jgi:ornithine carbamoyltransferase
MQTTQSSSHRSGLHAGGEFLAGDLSAVHELACRQKAASLAGRTGGRPLAGKNIALLRQRPPDAEMSVLHRAALDLGARVAHVRLGPPVDPGGTEFRHLSQMLGRLYDAIDCASLTPAEVRQIEQHAGVPVFDDLEGIDHPASVLADLMTLREHGCATDVRARIACLGEHAAERSENHRFVLQAMLLATMAGS